MSRWQRISMLQTTPQDIGNDSAGRVALRMNVACVKQPSSTAVEELKNILVTAGVGTFGGASGNIFISSKTVLPTGAGPFLLILETGGPGGVYQHNERGPAYHRPTYSLTVYGGNYAAAKAMWQAAYDALSVVTNQDVTP